LKGFCRCQKHRRSVLDAVDSLADPSAFEGRPILGGWASLYGKMTLCGTIADTPGVWPRMLVDIAARQGMASFGQWNYTADRAATILAYGRTERGGADTCNCVHCRNFGVSRAVAFPAEVLALLDKLGVDPRNDAEVYHNARLAPGRHHYGGWYHFVGALDRTGDFPPVDLGNAGILRSGTRSGNLKWLQRLDVARLSAKTAEPREYAGCARGVSRRRRAVALG
jgi:hypothetical protein